MYVNIGILEGKKKQQKELNWDSGKCVVYTLMTAKKREKTAKGIELG
jgi:hypothetical protein